MKALSPDLQAAIDTRLADAVVAANYRITLNTQKQNARLKLQKDLTFSINGGTFNITQELISFVTALIWHGKEEAHLLDVNSNPVFIDNLKEFADMIISSYYECTNEFMVEFAALKKARTPKALIGER